MAYNAKHLAAVPPLEPHPPRHTPIEQHEEAWPKTDLDEFDLPEVPEAQLLPGDRPLEKVIRALRVVHD